MFQNITGVTPWFILRKKVSIALRPRMLRFGDTGCQKQFLFQFFGAISETLGDTELKFSTHNY